ncbi:MAG: helix-turn-helix domain-containing protein [Lachnospiraceae bacterium]|nr:helix-turn-helix domain-containing protein [Lachnospiraceae bacterium]
MTIGERLTELRKSRGLSQEELAEQLTLTRQTISKWELGQSSPDIEYVIALCDLFGVSTDYLLKGEEPEAKAAPKEEHSQPVPKGPRSAEREKNWMIFGLGMAVSSLAFLVIAFFVIMSVVHPWVTYKSGKTYTGLAGYLLGTGSLPWFIGAAVLLLGGLAVAVFGIVRKPRRAE